MGHIGAPPYYSLSTCVPFQLPHDEYYILLSWALHASLELKLMPEEKIDETNLQGGGGDLHLLQWSALECQEMEIGEPAPR